MRYYLAMYSLKGLQSLLHSNVCYHKSDNECSGIESESNKLETNDLS